MSSQAPSQDDLQRMHDERLARLERNLAEAQKFIAVNAKQIAMIRQMLGLSPDYEERPTPI